MELIQNLNENNMACCCDICEKLELLFTNTASIDGGVFITLLDEINGCSKTTLSNLLASSFTVTDDQDCSDKKKIGSIDILGSVTDFFESITGFGTPAIDVTDPYNIEVSLPFTNEECEVQDVSFIIPIPNPVSVFNSIDLRFDANGDLIVEAVYTNDDGVSATITDQTPVSLPPDYVEYTGNNTVPTTTPPKGVDTRVLLNGTRYDWDGTQWIELKNPTCPDPMTRAQLIALRNAGDLDPQCHYIVTDPGANGNLQLQSVLLHAVDANTLSGCYLKTVHDNTAWNGSYDIDSNKVEYVHDHLRNNRVTDNISVISFPFGNTAAYDNHVSNTPITYTAGTFFNNVIDNVQQLVVSGTTFSWNTIQNAANVNITSGTFSVNSITTDANVTMSGGNASNNQFGNDSTTIITGGNVNNNRVGSLSRLTVSAGSFRENTIENESVVNSSSPNIVEENEITSRGTLTITAGNFARNTITSQARVTSSKSDVYRNEFSTYSNVNLSGTGNLEDSSIANESIYTCSSSGVSYQLNIRSASRLTTSGTASVQNTDISGNSQVTFISGSHYNNSFSERCVYTQVGTGYIRYSNIGGQATTTNGNVNISNLRSWVSPTNLTGSTGDIQNSNFDYGIVNATNCAQLYIRHSRVSEGGTITANSATRLYFYRSKAVTGGRILVSSGSRVDSSYSTASNYGYIQSTISGGFLTCNYSTADDLGYIRNTSPGSNSVSQSQVNSNGNIRFDGTATGCRVYYTSVTSNGAVYFTGANTNCYIYYGSAASNGQIYYSGGVTGRMYQPNATSRGYVRSLNNVATHYMYYCDASASGYVQMSGSRGRMYAIKADAQSIFEKRGNFNSNVYYSSITAYYYLYITVPGTGTRTGLHGYGRRTNTVTNPPNGSFVQNF